MKALLALLILIAFVCFVPLVRVSYPVVENQLIEESYTTIEPYTIQVEVQVPHTTYTTRAKWIDDGSWDYAKNYLACSAEEYMEVFQSVTPGRWAVVQQPTTAYRAEVKPVTRHRVVHKTRPVSKPTITHRWKRIPLVQGCQWSQNR